MMVSAILNWENIERLMALAHKIVHTFEKMDTINPTFELVLRFGLRDLFKNISSSTLTIYSGCYPFVSQVNTHLN
jgi:hypothetical protein